MRRECRERFHRHQLQRKPLAITSCITVRASRVTWCTSGSLSRGVGENVTGIPCACATRNLTYPARSPWINNQIDKAKHFFRSTLLARDSKRNYFADNCGDDTICQGVDRWCHSESSGSPWTDINLSWVSLNLPDAGQSQSSLRCHALIY